MMITLITLGTILVAFLHFCFFILESFLWEKSLGLKIFKLDPFFAKQSAALAKNQGLYNIFLSAGLTWSLITPIPLFAFQLKIFFLSCVILAGIVGAMTVSYRIFFIQTLPALITLIFLIVAA